MGAKESATIAMAMKNRVFLAMVSELGDVKVEWGWKGGVNI